MTAITTREGFDAFRDRMRDYFDTLPDGRGKKPLHVTQAELEAETFFTHQLDDEGHHHIVYDPRQTSALMVRQFLAIYADYTEGPVIDGARTAYYDSDSDGAREIWAIVLHEIDRTQDAGGVVDWVANLFAQELAEKGVRA